jgi:hypothetical protein
MEAPVIDIRFIHHPLRLCRKMMSALSAWHEHGEQEHDYGKRAFH